MQEKEVLNTEEAAVFLGVSAFTIREYAKAGTLPARKQGKRWFFYKPDLVAWVRGGHAQGPRPGGCIAYTDTGEICGAPATVLDPERGGVVCEKHQPKG